MDIECISKLVTAWRYAKKLSDGMDSLFSVCIDYMYDIHGNILDALRRFALEDCDMENSKILEWLEDESITSRQVAIDILAVRTSNTIITRTHNVQQPKPTFFTPEQIEAMQETFGAYVRSAER